MAQIRVKQIKDLSLTVPTTDNGFATLEVGTTTKDVLTSIAQGTPAQGATQNGIMTGITVSGNTITPVYKSIAEIITEGTIATESYVNGKIDALDTTSDVVIASKSGNTVTLKAGIAQENGLIKQGTGADITLADVATTGAAADVAIADTGSLFTAENVEAALAEVMGKVNNINVGVTKVTGSEAIVATPETGIGDVAVSLKIAESEKVLSQDGNGLKSTLTVDIANRNENGIQNSYIQIKGINGDLVSEVNANAFVKDGFLQKVELIEATAEGQENVLRFTWNSDAGIQVTEIKVSELCDVYTADETYLHLNGFKFEHIEVLDEEIIGVGNKTSDLKFSYPKLSVDKAGHVTQVTEQVINIPTTDTIDENDGTDLATEGAVKNYVDSQLSAQATKHVHVESTSTTIDLKQSRYTLVSTNNYNFDVYQNGIRLKDSEFSIDGTTMTIDPEVEHVPGDIYLVCYVVKATELPV